MGLFLAVLAKLNRIENYHHYIKFPHTEPKPLQTSFWMPRRHVWVPAVIVNKFAFFDLQGRTDLGRAASLERQVVALVKITRKIIELQSAIISAGQQAGSVRRPLAPLEKSLASARFFCRAAD